MKCDIKSEIDGHILTCHLEIGHQGRHIMKINPHLEIECLKVGQPRYNRITHLIKLIFK